MQSAIHPVVLLILFKSKNVNLLVALDKMSGDQVSTRRKLNNDSFHSGQNCDPFAPRHLDVTWSLTRVTMIHATKQQQSNVYCLHNLLLYN